MALTKAESICLANSMVLASVTVTALLHVLFGMDEGVKFPPCGTEIIIGKLPWRYSM